MATLKRSEDIQIAGPLQFSAFRGLRPGEGAPDHARIWLFKERQGETGMHAVFSQFDEQLRSQGLIGKEGKIIDASFVVTHAAVHDSQAVE